jgi:hypothetical protein
MFALNWFVCGIENILDRSLLQALSLPLDSQLKFQVWRKWRSQPQLNLIVRMAINGTFYLDSGSASYRGEWQSEDTLAGTISIPFVKQKISTSMTFDRSG